PRDHRRRPAGSRVDRSGRVTGAITPTSGGARFVGQRIQRREDARMVTGHGTYVDDVVVPRMVHAAFVRSNVARGRIVSVDVAEALAVDGVVAVLTADDINPHIHASWVDFQGPPGDAPGTPFRALAEGHVRYVGDPIALVLAESRYVAEDACELVVVD